MKPKLTLLIALLAPVAAAHAAEFHVSTNGNDANNGDRTTPLRTIQRAADLAQPGDMITVHAGIYRERVNPPRGGTSDSKRIVYQAAEGERVIVKGSEIVKGWKPVEGKLWTVTLPADFFGTFNPYADLIHGDYMFPNKQNQHTGMVYLNGEQLIEATAKDEKLDKPHWFGEVKDGVTTLWAWFNDADPNQETVEINVRQSVFYPSREHIDYLTVRGFEMSHAAANWAPPTAEQVGLLGTHWSKGWIIENNTISHSRCVGITLGKFGDKFDNTYKMDSQGWNKGVKEALDYGWNKDSVGHHLVRNNTISFCGQAGIVGSLGAIFSVISGNLIHDTAWQQRFNGYETAGIKLHGAVDVTIHKNHIYRSAKAIWLDWMAQGVVVEQNLFHDNREVDLMVEVSHGPHLVCNNIFLSNKALQDDAGGSAYVHNLFTGGFIGGKQVRTTPVFRPHGLEGIRVAPVRYGDNRYYNNLFVGTGVSKIDDRTPVWMAGNVLLKGAKPGKAEACAFVAASFDPKLKLTEKPDGWYLSFAKPPAWADLPHALVTSKLLGKVETSQQDYENPDGSPVCIATDYFGNKREASNPTPGPFEAPGQGAVTLKVW